MTALYTTPSPSTCGKCEAAVWSVIIDGEAVHLDPTPLDIGSELLARLQDKFIAQIAPNRQMQWRWVEHVIHTPNAVRLAEHDCATCDRGPIVPLFADRKPVDLPERPEY